MASEVRIISDVVQIAAFPSWPVPPIALQAGQGSFDLKATLPAGVPTGGVFGTVAPPPAWLALTTDGIVSAASEAAIGTATVQFTYTLPSAS